MKIIKISLALIVLLAIGAGIFFWVQKTKKPQQIKSSENQFTHKIEQEIEQLKRKPDTSFCGDFFKEIVYHINDFYELNRFGSNQLENNQWKENLEKILYVAYTEKFINQAKTVFRNSVWEQNKLKFIQSEKNELKRSKLLVAGSPIDKEFTTIQTVLNKYNEIVSFISSCKGYGYSETMLTDRFPIVDVQNKISVAANLLNNRLENEFVNNCVHLHEELKNIPQELFTKHVLYLDNKIDYWSGLFANYNSQKDYSNNLYNPLKAEIEALDNDIYNVPNFDIEFNRLLQKWSADNTKAYNFKYQ